MLSQNRNLYCDFLGLIVLRNLWWLWRDLSVSVGRCQSRDQTLFVGPTYGARGTDAKEDPPGHEEELPSAVTEHWNRPERVWSLPHWGCSRPSEHNPVPLLWDDPAGGNWDQMIHCVPSTFSHSEILWNCAFFFYFWQAAALGDPWLPPLHPFDSDNIFHT